MKAARIKPEFWLIGTLIFLTGCASMLQKQTYDLRTSGLFMKAGKVSDNESRLNIRKMLEQFLSIRETDEKNGIFGDTIPEVRRKGFNIYMDGDEKNRRPNTRQLYGNEALLAIGMGVSQPPLPNPEEIIKYSDFMGQHYGEEYMERDLKKEIDVICLNTRNSLEIGDDYSFVIVWRNGYVLKRVIKGGPVDNPKKEHAILLCVGDVFGDVIGGGIRMVIPKP